MTDTGCRAMEWIAGASLGELMAAAAMRRDSQYGRVVSYSKKVFIPLTQLCRDICHYCTFAKSPRAIGQAFLRPEQVLDLARRGEAAGCTEALFTLGDKPELRYRAARQMLAELGHDTTISYLGAMCELVLRETSLMPHVNAGVMSGKEMAGLRDVSVSQGIMLESASARLCEKGQVHHGSPDKHPAIRLENIRMAGELSVPFTTGILIGIGETRAERLESLVAIGDLHARYGHIQEVIVQNFRAKPETKLAAKSEPSLDELMWTVAAARLILQPEINLQAPPNLSPQDYQRLIEAGINDWGGISPVTIDHVNPEAPWPEIGRLSAATRAAGLELAPRLPVYPDYVADLDRWLDATVAPHVLALADGEGLAREDEWAAGAPEGSELDNPSPRAAASFKGALSLLPAASLQGKDAQVDNGSVPEASR